MTQDCFLRFWGTRVSFPGALEFPPRTRLASSMRSCLLPLLLVLGLSFPGVACKRQTPEARTIPEFTPAFDAKKAGMTPLFDGHTLLGWVGDTDHWKVINGTLVGTGENQSLMTERTFGSFRLLVSSIQVDGPENHQGVGFWGKEMVKGKFGYGDCLMVMPPMNWLWDYANNREPLGTVELSRDLEKENGVKRSQWTQAELLVDNETGLVRLAVNGIEVVRYQETNAKRPREGPLCLQSHAKNRDVRYKDLFIELNPPNKELITLRK